MTATQLLVVPKSIPIILDILTPNYVFTEEDTILMPNKSKRES